MKVISQLALIGAVAITAACSDSGGGSSEGTVSLTGDAALPEQMSLVGAQDETTASGLSLSSGMASRSLVQGRAVLDTSTLPSDSDYVSSKQNVYVWLDAVEPISFIDSLLCFTNQSRPLAMKDQGDYISWNDASRCFEDQGQGSDDSQGSGEQVQQFVTIVGNSSQASATDPLIYKGWVEDYAGQSGEDGGPSVILMLGEVRNTPTDANPFGEFTLTYGLLPTLASTEADNQGFGEVVSSAASAGGASFTLYQKDSYEDNSVQVNCTTSASVDYNESTQTGLARTGSVCLEADTGNTSAFNDNAAFALAVNSDYVHMGKAATYSQIDAGTFDSQVCLARDGFNSVVWNYSLYNKADGSEVAINSGMQLKVDGDGDGTGTDSNGFENWGNIGYWGSWREDGQGFTDGETVQQATFDDTVGDNFTVKVAPGRLVKNTVDSVNLADLDGVTFSTWINENDSYLLDLTAPTDFNGDSDSTGGFEVMLEANSDNNGFEVTGIRSNGGEVTPVSPAVAVPLNTGVVLNMWSRQLGGNIRYLADATAVRFFTRSFVDGSETATGELFDGGTSPVTLKCFERCLDVNIAATDISGGAVQEAVFVSDSSATAQDYTFSNTDLTLKIVTDSVKFSDAVTKDNIASSQHWSWGVNSGPMVSSASGITTRTALYSAIEAGSVDFYTWETGLEHWQQQMVLIDSSDNVVSFDKPVTIKYTHATANDRNTNSSENGKVFLLEYGGKGQLWGLPFEQGDNNRWGPVINIKDGVILGSTSQYIIKANNVEQRMQVAASSNCADLPLTAPSQAVPTGITGGVFDIGSMPDISEQAPSVVDGEVTE
ncbi:MAG: hypothetical protein ACI843_000761 [Psychrobacter glaciei]|jgi:hypothetical protein